MSDKPRKDDRAPPMPRDLPMPPYRYQTDCRGSNGAAAKPSRTTSGVGILRGANLSV